jgi:hypothetical protein
MKITCMTDPLINVGRSNSSGTFELRQQNCPSNHCLLTSFATENDEKNAMHGVRQEPAVLAGSGS